MVVDHTEVSANRTSASEAIAHDFLIEAGVVPIRRIAIIGNAALSMVNFRGPLIRALSRRGVEIFAVAPGYTDILREEVTAAGAKAIEISLERAAMRPARDMMDFLRLAAILRRLRVDATLSYFSKPVIYGSLAAGLARIPRRFALIEGLGYVFESMGKHEAIRRRALRAVVAYMYRHALALNERVFFLNPDDVRDFVKRGVVAAEKVQRLDGIGVDLSHYAPVPAVTEPVTFLLIARLLAAKGIREYVAAAERVKSRYPKTRFLLLGGLDPNPGALKQSEVQAWAQDGLVEWPGEVSDVRAWIAQASVYVLPSYYREGVPRSILEAMAMGRPIITTDWVGCRETVVPGENGFLVPVENVEAVTQTMLRFVAQPSLISSMGQSSRRIAEERFDVNKVNSVILNAMGL